MCTAPGRWVNPFEGAYRRLIYLCAAHYIYIYPPTPFPYLEERAKVGVGD